MRRFLLNLGCLYACVVPVAGAMTVSGGIPIGAGLTTVVFGLGFSMALSAPYVLAPPAERQVTTFWMLPLNFWIVAQVFRLAIWLGGHVLNLAWSAVFAVWGERQRRKITFDAAARPVAFRP